MTELAPINADELVLGGILARWLPGVRLGTGELAVARRAVLRVGAALGVIEEDSERAFFNAAAPYQSAVIVRAFDAEAARLMGVARPAPAPLTPIPTGKPGPVAILCPVELKPILDVNSASTAELAALPGLGEASAARVMARRPYQTLDEVAHAARLGKEAFARARPMLRIGALPQPPVAAAALDVLDRGLGALVSGLASGALRHPLVSPGEPARTLVKLLDLLAAAIEPRRVRPRFFRPSPERLARSSGALARALTLRATACTGGVRGALVAGGAYLPVVTALVEAASQRVWLTMFYFMVEAKGPGRKLLERLAAARARGVDVRVILADDLPGDIHGAHAINGGAAAALAQARIPTRRTHVEVSAHGKAVVVDDRHVLTGSHNWTSSSFYRYDDTSAYIESTALAARLAGWLERRWRLLADDAEAERAVALQDLESLTPPQQQTVLGADLDDGATFRARAAADAGALAAELGWPVERVTRVAAIVGLMKGLRIAEITAVALLARGLATPDAVRATDDATLTAALSDLSMLPAPFSGRAIPTGMIPILRGEPLRGVA